MKTIGKICIFDFTFYNDVSNNNDINIRFCIVVELINGLIVDLIYTSGGEFS